MCQDGLLAHWGGQLAQRTSHDSLLLRWRRRFTVRSFAKADSEGTRPVTRSTVRFSRCPITSACSAFLALMLSAGGSGHDIVVGSSAARRQSGAAARRPRRRPLSSSSR